MSKLKIVGAMSALLIALLVPANAEMGWLPGDGIPGIDRYVYSVTTWDPDAEGPSPELLVAGGDFYIAGDVQASHVAVWNGSSWQKLAIGMSGSVYALTVYNGQLIVGGLFTHSGGTTLNRIAAWNGSIWQSLSSGMNGAVRALTVYDGQLIAAGDFNTAGGIAANRIAAWNGTNWLPLGSGMNNASTVSALTVHSGQLIAGGVN